MPPSRTSAVSLPRWSIALVKRSVIWPSADLDLPPGRHHAGDQQQPAESLQQ